MKKINNFSSNHLAPITKCIFVVHFFLIYYNSNEKFKYVLEMPLTFGLILNSFYNVVLIQLI